MQQLEIISHLARLAEQQQALVVSEIGSQTQWLYASGDRDHHLYLTGPMGMGVSVALGVALAQPSLPVLGIVGDGALAMNLNGLATLSYMAPTNLSLAVMDNAVYDLTGQVDVATKAVDWLALARSMTGFSRVEAIDLESPLTLSATGGLTFYHAKIKPSDQKAPSFDLTPEYIHQRFHQYLNQRLKGDG